MLFLMPLHRKGHKKRRKNLIFTYMIMCKLLYNSRLIVRTVNRVFALKYLSAVNNRKINSLYANYFNNVGIRINSSK